MTLRRKWQVLFRRRRSAKPRARAVKHPVRNDFHTVVSKTGVSVTFKPPNGTYSFYWLTDNSAIAPNGPVSLTGVHHGGCNTGDYPRMKFKIWRSKLRQNIPRSILVSFQTPAN
jgi:hypothetical protein